MAVAARFESSAFAQRLRSEVEGEVRFDDLTRGLYSTDASIYQMLPLGVVIPNTTASAIRAVQLCAENRRSAFGARRWNIAVWPNGQ